MTPRIRLDTANFNRAVNDLQRQLKVVPLERVIDYELGKVLSATLANTDAASVSSIRKNYDDTEWATLNGKKYKLSNRFPNAVWSQIATKRKASLVRKLAARGMAKQSFLALGKLIGVEVIAPGYVVSASVPNRSNAENVDIKRMYGDLKYGIIITDKSPLLRWTGAKSAFIGAMIGRQKFYAQNLRRGVFDDISQVMKKYPGMIVAY